MVVTSPAASDSDVRNLLVISLELNTGSRIVTTHKFVYHFNPSFTNIEPRNHLVMCVFTAILEIYLAKVLEKNDDVLMSISWVPAGIFAMGKNVPPASPFHIPVPSLFLPSLFLSSLLSVPSHFFSTLLFLSAFSLNSVRGYGGAL